MNRLLALLLLLLAAPALAQTTVTIDGFDYTIPDHPRVFLDGPSGPITTRLKDPDGAGAQRAPRAIDGDPAYEALKTRIRSCVAEAPPYPNCAGYESVTLAAIDWFMDNTQTNSLNFAIYKLNNAEGLFNAAMGGGAGNELGCDIFSNYCDLQDYSHWASYILMYLSQAYSLVRSEMTAGERLAFARKMVNDVDVNISEGPCVNQLQLNAGAVVSHYVSGSTTVTGTGFTGITEGATLHIKPTLTADGGWAVVNTVTDTQLTLNSRLNGYSGQPIPTIGPGATQGKVFELGPIEDDTCGAVWQAGNHLSNHTHTFGRRITSTQAEQIDTTETDFTLTSVAGFPTPPFLLKVVGTSEVVRVTAVNANTFTVQRDWPRLDGVGSASFSGTVLYNKMLPNGSSDGDPRNNRILLKATGALAAGLAALDDVPGYAEGFINGSGWFLKDYMIPAVRADWTGFTQGGSYYSYTINTPFSLALVDMARKFTPVGAAPSLDYSGDGWPARFAYGLIYNGLPAAPTTPISWGSQGLAESRSYFWTPFLVGFAPTSDASKHLQYWLTNTTTTYTEGTLAGSTFKPYLVFSLIHMPTTLDPVDYRTVLPKHRAFNVVDSPPGQPWGTYISRTGFSSTGDSLLWVNTHQPHYGNSDHMLAGAPASYRYYKNGYMMPEHGVDNIGAGTATNMMLFGGAANLKVYTAVGQWQEVWNDKDDGAATWAYTRVNSVNAYTPTAAASRALRHFVHFKAGNPDFVVVYDDVASSVGKTKQVNLYHDNHVAAGSEPAGVCTTYSWVAPTATCLSATRSLYTKLVHPTGTNLFVTPASLTYGKRIAVCLSQDGATCDATNTAGDMLVVHQGSTSAAEAQVATDLLGTIDSDFIGVQIGGSNPAIAVFAKVGLTHTSSSFTTTHSGTATYVVTGLTAGAYDVVRGGVTTILDDHVVDLDGVLSFTSVAGAFTVVEGTAPPPECTVATNSLPNATDSVAYSHQLLHNGCTGAVTWTKETDTCPEIDVTSGGLIEQADPDIGTCTETYKVTDSLAQFGTKELPLTTVAAPATCTITSPTSLPDAVLGVAYDFTLSTSGCTGPLTFTPTPSDFCPGLLLNATTGAFSDDPTVVGLCTFDVGLVPTAGGNTSKQHTILVNAPPPAELQILTTSPLGQCVQNQACSTTFQGLGGVLPYTWSKDSGTYCVGNDSLVAGTGVLSGAPSQVETCTFVIKLTDSDSPPVSVTRTFERTVTASPPGLSVVTIPSSGAVIVKFGTPALDGSQDCTIDVSDQTINPDTGASIGVVASTVSTGGRATRVVALEGLIAQHPHRVDVVCGAVASGQADFTTAAAVGGTISWRYAVPPTPSLQAKGAAKLTVEAVPVSGAHALDSGVAHHWTMNEESGARADARNPGATNSWTANGSPSFGEGVYGNAVAVTPTSYLSLGTSTVFPERTFTLAFRIKISSFTPHNPEGSPIFVSDNTETGMDVYRPFGGTATNFKVYSSTTEAALAGDALTVDAWHLVMVWHNQTTGQGGIQVDDGTSATYVGGSFARTTGNMFIAFDDPVANITALVDDVTLWTGRVLSADDRALLVAGDNYPFGSVSVTEACAVSCTVVLPLESGRAYNLRHVWKTAADVVLATSAYAPIATP